MQYFPKERAYDRPSIPCASATPAANEHHSIQTARLGASLSLTCTRVYSPALQYT
jgi:hypothetical protein